MSPRHDDTRRHDNDKELVDKMRAAHRLATRDRAVSEMLADVMRKAEESGELKQFHGQPLDLDDDPNWFLKRTLKQAGISHPLLERAGDLDAIRDQAEELIARLADRRDRIERNTGDRDYQRRHAFNDERIRVLDEYRDKLRELNNATLSYNLQVPSALYRPPVNIEAAVDAVTQAIPPLSLEVTPKPLEPQPRSRRFNLFRKKTKP